MPAKLRETPAQPWRASALQNFALACITLLGQSSKTGVVSELKDQSEQGWDLIEPAADMGRGFFGCRNCSHEAHVTLFRLN